MLFNSYEFIFGFLPLALIGFYTAGARSRVAALSWLAIASLAFYGAPYFIHGDYGPLPSIVLAASIVGNYWAGRAIIRLGGSGAASIITGLAVSADLGVLAYFKYSGFLIENFTTWFGDAIPWQVLLPIGISFYTFTQIAFLVDARKGKVEHLGFIEYVLFVTWFPHLIAGPILHHSEMIGQFQKERTVRMQWRNIAIGTAIFSFGLAKKILIADSIAPYANTVFAATSSVSMNEAWLGVLAYTMQLYFDFSGYSDMAIGLSRLFNVDLPLNFYSPYKASSMVEFWRRWHISLSRFLRDYLYIPLGGNRTGTARRYANLMITMLLGGLWHGAAWTFVTWGTLHGFYLLINHAWAIARRRYAIPALPGSISWLATFLAVVVAWVFFRSPDLISGLSMLAKMAGLGDLWTINVVGSETAWLWVMGATAIALLMPNTQQIFQIPFNPRGSKLKTQVPNVEPRHFGKNGLRWRPSFVWALVCAALFGTSLSLLTRTSEFLYFQF